MLNRVRVAAGLDVQRLAAAIRGPGIDTRCWVSLAVALADSKVDLVKSHEGVFVDAKLMPSEQVVTARIGPVYAGDGFGLYAHILKDDELAVVVPSGNAAQGAIVIARLWSAADKPPAEAQTNPEDLLLVVEGKRSLRIVIRKGGGKARIAVEGDNGTISDQLLVDKDKIELGGENAGHKASLDDKVQAEFNRVHNELNALADSVAKHRHAEEMHYMPLIPNPAQPLVECVKSPLTFSPLGVPTYNLITTAEAKKANAPLDAEAGIGEYIPRIPPDLKRDSSLFPDGQDPAATNSERVTIDK